MMWFRHYSDAGRNEKLMALRDEFGMAGYGAYWAILEAIAEKMDSKSKRCCLELSVKNWKKITDFSTKKLQNFFTFSKKANLFLSKSDGNMVKVECPKLLEYRDEYTRKAMKKAGFCPDTLPPASVSAYDSASANDKDINTSKEETPFD